jgi:hypothetical protein
MNQTIEDRKEDINFSIFGKREFFSPDISQINYLQDKQFLTSYLFQEILNFFQSNQEFILE